MRAQPFVSVEETVKALMQEREKCTKDAVRRPRGQDLISWPQGGGFQVRFNRLPAPAEIEQIRDQLTDKLEQRDTEGNCSLPVKRIEFHTRSNTIRVVADKARQHLTQTLEPSS